MSRRTAALAALFLLVASVTVATGAGGNPPFTWAVSASQTDPTVNVGFPTGGVASLYLWAIPGIGVGWESACFGFATTGIVILAVIPAGPEIQITDGCFSTPQCPSQPVVVASVVVLDLEGEICMIPAAIPGTNCTVDCSTPPQAWENSWVGYTNQAATPCSYDSWAPCGPVGVEGDTWGKIKAVYR